MLVILFRYRVSGLGVCLFLPMKFGDSFRTFLPVKAVVWPGRVLVTLNVSFEAREHTLSRYKSVMLCILVHLELSGIYAMRQMDFIYVLQIVENILSMAGYIPPLTLVKDGR